MKKKFVMILCTAVVLAAVFGACQKQGRQAVVSMLDSYEQSEDIILLTCFELVVDGIHYDLDDIRYNGQPCSIVFLEEDGFYSYVEDARDRLSVEFLYTSYETFETTSLGAAMLPSKIIHAFWGDDCFWFRMDDPNVDTFQQMYYSWNVQTKQEETVAHDSISEDYPYSIDRNRSERYSFAYTSKAMGSYLEITDKESGVTKKIDRSILKTFEEGKKIRKGNLSTGFHILNAFEDNGTIYLASFFVDNLLSGSCYCYVYQWDFETEECALYTSVCFDSYQEWVTDLYIK